MLNQFIKVTQKCHFYKLYTLVANDYLSPSFFVKAEKRFLSFPSKYFR